MFNINANYNQELAKINIMYLNNDSSHFGGSKIASHNSRISIHFNVFINPPIS